MMETSPKSIGPIQKAVIPFIQINEYPFLSKSFVKKEDKYKNVLLIPVQKMSTELKIDNTQSGKLVGDINKTDLLDSLSLNSETAKWIELKRDSLQPWSKFGALSSMRIPNGGGNAVRRIAGNVDKFQSNYLVLIVIVCIICLLTSPLLLLILICTLCLLYGLQIKNKGRKFYMAGHHFTLNQQRFVLFMLSTPFYVMAGAGAAVFWIIGASILSVLIHALLMPFEVTSNEVFHEIKLEDAKKKVYSEESSTSNTDNTNDSPIYNTSKKKKISNKNLKKSKDSGTKSKLPARILIHVEKVECTV